MSECGEKGNFATDSNSCKMNDRKNQKGLSDDGSGTAARTLVSKSVAGAKHKRCEFMDSSLQDCRSVKAQRSFKFVLHSGQFDIEIHGHLASAYKLLQLTYLAQVLTATHIQFPWIERGEILQRSSRGWYGQCCK